MTEAVTGPARADIIRHTTIAHAVVAVVIALVITVIGWPLGLGLWAVLVGVVTGAGVAAFAFTRGDDMALTALGAELLTPGRFAHFDNVVEGLVVSSGVRMPDLYVIDDAAPNAFVVGRSSRHGALAVTTGLVESLPRIELEGVLAHELSRIRSGEARAAVAASTLICRPLGFTGGFAQSLAARLVDPASGVRADLAAVSLTRYPPGLAAALSRVDADGRTVARDIKAYRHLWLDPPADAMVGAQFSMSDRIEVLSEL